jgi:hypothetical protein
MNKPEEGIKFIAIANLIERQIVIDYVPQTKREKVSNVLNYG